MGHLRPTTGSIKLIISLLGLLGGLYLVVDVSAPALTFFNASASDVIKHELDATKPGIKGDRLYIPKINVDVAIVTGENAAVLEQGAWHRHPENGDPENGGNFVLSAHRFSLGLTPQQTVIKSPFYNIDKLQLGDEIYVDYEGSRYAYKVTRHYGVERTATEIEVRTAKATMTLYSCDLRGEKAGREVIEASLL